MRILSLRPRLPCLRFQNACSPSQDFPSATRGIPAEEVWEQSTTGGFQDQNEFEFEFNRLVRNSPYLDFEYMIEPCDDVEVRKMKELVLERHYQISRGYYWWQGTKAVQKAFQFDFHGFLSNSSYCDFEYILDILHPQYSDVIKKRKISSLKRIVRLLTRNIAI